MYEKRIAFATNKPIFLFAVVTISSIAWWYWSVNNLTDILIFSMISPRIFCMEKKQTRNLGGRPPGREYPEKVFARLTPEQLKYLREKFTSASDGIRTLIEQDMGQQKQPQP